MNDNMTVIEARFMHKMDMRRKAWRQAYLDSNYKDKLALTQIHELDACLKIMRHFMHELKWDYNVKVINFRSHRQKRLAELMEK